MGEETHAKARRREGAKSKDDFALLRVLCGFACPIPSCLTRRREGAKVRKVKMILLFFAFFAASRASHHIIPHAKAQRREDAKSKDDFALLRVLRGFACPIPSCLKGAQDEF
jgi:hypothetical protein